MTSATEGARLRLLGTLAVRLARCAAVDQVGPAVAEVLAGAGLPLLPDGDRAAPDAVPLPGGLGVLVAATPADREFLGLVAVTVRAALENAAARGELARRIAELEALDQARSELIGNASHELRTPLTLVAAPAEEALADTDQPLPPAQRDRVQLIRRNAARLRRLLNNILDFTRIAGGGLRAELVGTDLAALTSSVAASFAPAVERGGLEFAVDCPPLPRTAFVDREMWERIVLNLLSNALKHTLRGRVAIRLREDGPDVLLSVEDTGVGIPPDQVPLLFRRFHRVRGNVGRTAEGAGIGLALVHELTGLHGGTVAVRSTPGQGSTFEVRVPYGAGATTAPAPPSGWVREVHLAEAFGWTVDEPEAPSGPGGGPPVLVVEDNAELRGYLVRLLGPHWTVRSAADGPAALALARSTRPELVLAHAGLPEADGLDLLAALRADPDTRDVPVIMMSARAGAEAAADALHAGADDYLVKPFSSVELLARVRSTIELARQRAHLREREAIQARFAARLAEATEVGEVLAAAVGGLGAPWSAGAVVVASWNAEGRPRVLAGPPWGSLPEPVRAAFAELRRRVGLSVITHPADPVTGAGAGAGATLDVVGEDTAVWLDLPAGTVLTSADRSLFRALCGQLGLALSRGRAFEQQRTVAVTCSARSSGRPPRPAAASPSATSRRTAPWRSAATGTTSSTCPTATRSWWWATASAAVCRRRP